MRKFYNLQNFELSKDYTIECETQNTNYGFRHLAVLRQNGTQARTAKSCYYNRTWEEFTYQSVGHEVIDGYFDESQAKIYRDIFDKIGRKEAESFLKIPSLIATLGDVFCETDEDKNKWKKRFIEKIPGIDFPEDFDTLPEDEKKRRLDKVIALGLKDKQNNK